MAEVDRATQRLLRSVAELDDQAVAAASLLPDWSRGHVLAHLARHADGYTNLLTGARTGQPVPQYASVAARAADIEAAAGRPAAAHLDDLRGSAARLADAADAMTPEAWTVTVHPTTGSPRPAAALVWGRLREVEVHHVDLAVGYGPADWTDAFSQRLLREVVHQLGARPDTSPLVLHATGIEHPLSVGAGSDAREVSGSCADLAAWLAGRSDGRTLVFAPAGEPPSPPRWL